ncbi:type-2 ice-structuring protein-like [Astatotilapia calliptera]|uniref:type-2 ice-structuring protein-like n=1 Tax=Astatotilapia calliptera TaxID=8154 RepID=UPI000E40007F|nr:type-2 ice-structuring protein-like [Astatotilapia calliptera]XP_026018287.1 type-2 ice-structuring protein-like [Astatotilapia calliptera]
MKLLTLCALLCAMIAVTTAGAKSHLVKRCIYCPDGWNQPRCPYGWTQFGSRCFTYNQTPMSWDSAKRHCWGLGANLASVHTYWEHQRLVQLLGNTPVWIGGSKGLKGTWFWSDGTGSFFSQWCWGEPSNGHYENCLQMSSRDSNCWLDSWCGYHLPSVCAKNIVN